MMPKKKISTYSEMNVAIIGSLFSSGIGPAAVVVMIAGDLVKNAASRDILVGT